MDNQIPGTQIAKSLDPITMVKIMRSAEIAASGIVLIVGPLFGYQLIHWLDTGEPIQWRHLASLSLTAIGAWIINSLRQWQAGKQQDTI